MSTVKKSISKMKEKANLLRLKVKEKANLLQLLKPKGNESVSTPQPVSTQHFKKNAADKVQKRERLCKVQVQRLCRLVT